MSDTRLLTAAQLQAYRDTAHLRPPSELNDTGDDTLALLAHIDALTEQLAAVEGLLQQAALQLSVLCPAPKTHGHVKTVELVMRIHDIIGIGGAP